MFGCEQQDSGMTISADQFSGTGIINDRIKTSNTAGPDGR